jgi:nucleoside-diphosphate-sugar epimerase
MVTVVSSQPVVLVTGAAGWTARAIIQALIGEGFQVVGLDLHAPQADDGATAGVRWVQGDVADPTAVARASRSASAVVHLAVAVGAGDYRRPQRPFATNVLGTYNVFDAARRAGLGRVVLVSSAAVHLPPGSAPLSTSEWRSSPGDNHLYDLTKRLQEEVARDFCATFAMSAVVLRAGHLVDGTRGVDAHGRPLAGLGYARGGWLCRYDLARACLRALRFPHSGYHAFHVVGSRVAQARFDLERTERELGFRCAMTFDEDC